jgi:hypothetical protein
MGFTKIWTKGLSTFYAILDDIESVILALRGYKIVPLPMSFETAFESLKLDLE